MVPNSRRRLPVGAELLDGGDGVHFRVWAPKRQRVDVELEDGVAELDAETDGYFSGVVASARAGSRYKLRLDGASSFPDPASRFQPEGPHGPSMVVDPHRFRWSDSDWPGVTSQRLVLYEIHVGTFTPEGTFAAAAEQLPELAGLGITTVEIMPVAEFAGRFGWGYDGVDWFAPYHHYGEPDDLRAFVNRAHAEGLSVILDVVYNHFGPDGNYVTQFSDAYVSRKHRTDWGEAINFDGESSTAVREFVLSNAGHWISEYHFDGLRLDATDNIYDDSEPHILQEIAETARAAAGRRALIVVAENEAQRTRLLQQKPVGFGLDFVWSDDFHHTAIVAATGRREAYYTDYGGTAQELISAVKRGYLYQGQRYSWQRQRRGTSTRGIAPHRFVHFLENHDQVANSATGARLNQLTSPGRYRALSALLLLAPQTPLVFQGQEFAASTPFLFFADHHQELRRLVREGRREFFSQFPSMADRTMQLALADPGEQATFERSKLDQGERARHAPQYLMYRDLIALRQCDPVLGASETVVDGAALGGHGCAFAIRFFGPDDSDRLLIVNLGADLALEIVPEPLLAPPCAQRDAGWTRLWHSEDPCYGGRGAPSPESENGAWRIPAESATLLGADSE